MDPWWTAQQAGLLDGIGGVFGGLLGAFYGVWISCLVPRGLGRRTVPAIMTAMATFAIALLVAGAAAVLAGQPFHVYHPLLLMGAVLYLVVLPVLPVVLSSYRVTEAMQKAGLQPNVWGERAAEVRVAAVDEAWNHEGDLYRMCGVLFRSNLAVGMPVLLIGLALLLGSGRNHWIAPTAIGACLSVCAGMLWMMRRMYMGQVGPGAEGRRLAAEELRRS